MTLVCPPDCEVCADGKCLACINEPGNECGHDPVERHGHRAVGDEPVVSRVKTAEMPPLPGDGASIEMELESPDAVAEFFESIAKMLRRGGRIRVSVRNIRDNPTLRNAKI